MMQGQEGEGMDADGQVANFSQEQQDKQRQYEYQAQEVEKLNQQLSALLNERQFLAQEDPMMMQPHMQQWSVRI